MTDSTRAPAGFDRAFFAWWLEDGPQPDLGEATPADDLASFKQMLAEHGWVIAERPGTGS